MPSRSFAHIRSKSSRPLPATESASEMVADPSGRMAHSRRRRSLSGKERRSSPLSDQIESHIGGRPCGAEQVIELRPAGLVDCDHLPVDYRIVDIEQSRHLVPERVETGHAVVSARDETGAPLLDIAKGPETVIFGI